MGVTRFNSIRFNICIASVISLALPFVLTAFSMIQSQTVLAQPKPPAVVVVQMQRLARYTMAKLEPDAAQQNPLASTISIHLPRESVKTVGDAVRYLLVRTGYRLADGLPPDVSDVLTLSLPEVHRQLGPYTVTEALNLLMGSTYTLDVDATRRVVAYRATTSAAPQTSSVVTLNSNVVASRDAPDESISKATSTQTK
jgi:conjugative transfer region protein (TIGR03748 family)